MIDKTAIMLISNFSLFSIFVNTYNNKKNPTDVNWILFVDNTSKDYDNIINFIKSNCNNSHLKIKDVFTVDNLEASIDITRYKYYNIIKNAYKPVIKLFIPIFIQQRYNNKIKDFMIFDDDIIINESIDKYFKYDYCHNVNWISQDTYNEINLLTNILSKINGTESLQVSPDNYRSFVSGHFKMRLFDDYEKFISKLLNSTKFFAYVIKRANLLRNKIFKYTLAYPIEENIFNAYCAYHILTDNCSEYLFTMYSDIVQTWQSELWKEPNALQKIAKANIIHACIEPKYKYMLELQSIIFNRVYGT